MVEALCVRMLKNYEFVAMNVKGIAKRIEIITQRK